MFLYPPRPVFAIAPPLIGFYERRGWLAQIKKNGTCSVASNTNGLVEFRTRHNDMHKAWTPTDEAKEFFVAYPNSYFVFELLHSKGGGVRDTLYLFDVLKFGGESLVGSSLEKRLDLLQGLSVSGNISMAKTFKKNLAGLYKGLTSPLDEGIVLKDPNAVLSECFRDGTNANWQVKVRKPTKNFGF
jgi:hypothetical protein